MIRVNPKLTFWLIVLGLIALQGVFSLNSTHQIRYEELAEGVRNPFFLDHHLIYDGTSSNIGWYSLLLIIYKIFGFSLFGYKIFRVVLSAISLFCLAKLLRKYLGQGRSIIPLITIGLSPTLLYLNTLGAEFGFDLQLAPIILYLLTFTSSKKIWLALTTTMLFWGLSMLGWLSYPIFILYLPVLLILYLKWNFKKSFLFVGKIALSVVSFTAPLLLLYNYIYNRGLLIFDPHTKGGLFRGAGSLNLDLGLLSSNLIATLGNFFNQGQGYHFELSTAEFSLLFPAVTVLYISFLSFKFFRKHKNARMIIVLSWAIILLNIILVSFTVDPSGHPGGRRNTAILIGFYCLFATSWKYVDLKKAGFWLLLLLPLHHLIAYPINLDGLSNPSPYRYTLWLGEESPGKTLDSMVETLKNQDLKFNCDEKSLNAGLCRYGEIYSLLEGSCKWNNLDCKQVLGFDPKKNKFIPLSPNLWERYYFPH